MNLTRSQKVRLGTFVATGVTIFLGSVLTLAGLKVWERRDVYFVRFTESVSGLETSSQVRYQGLRVGRVEAMKVADDDPGAIEVTLSLQAGTVLYEGTTAVLDISGITGLKNINLTPGETSKKRLAPGTMLPAGASFVDRLTGKAESISVKVEMVSNQLLQWTRDENRERVERLLDSVTKLTDDLDQTIVEGREPMIAALKSTAAAGDAIQGTARATTKTLDEIREELKLALGNAQGTLGEVRRILRAVDDKAVGDTVRSARNAMATLDTRLSDPELTKALSNLQDALIQLSKLLQETELAVRAGREDFIMSLKHVRQATEDLREFSRIIAQDPSVLLRGKEVE